MPAVPVTRLLAALTETSTLAVIPARFDSSRLPGKALADLDGRPMIEHVYRRAQAAAVDAVIVATDDERIVSAVEKFGGAAVMTARHHRSGTERLAEIATALPCATVVNVQGDEPLLDPRVIDSVLHALRTDPSIDIATAARPLSSSRELHDSNVVKVVCDRQGAALYFSRRPLPYATTDEAALPHARAHLGLYGYRREALLRLSRLSPTPLEALESLEQLRALEHGMRIRVVDTDAHSMEVNTLEDLEAVRHYLRQQTHA